MPVDGEPLETQDNVAGQANHRAPERDEDASDAQAQIIASLRAQVTDLFTQVTQLNSKLVSSYDRVSGLEDQLHEASSSLRNATITVSSLELERAEYLAALNTGLLVEKAHVTAELNRLMERATEEAAQRGQAESARHDIEKDLDDLSATLFDQANTMVAEARLNQARSERKVQEAEEALRSAEEAVKVMQAQMQALESDKLAAQRETLEARVTMGKGKWVEHENPRKDIREMRLLMTHTPYAEFTTFIVHLRTLRSSQLTPPPISSLLHQPFLARLISEDSEPTVRLDLAPSLNWLSRRSVLAAIHTGMLNVQPMSFPSLLQELSPQSQASQSISCALCGTHIARLPSELINDKPALYPLAALTRSSSSKPKSSWFNYTRGLSSSSNVNITAVSRSEEQEHPEQIYVFRLAGSASSQPPPLLSSVHSKTVSVPSPSSSFRPPIHPSTTSRMLPTQSNHPPYPLCTSNYCLLRLRTTCSLWAFVRTGIVERVWEGEIIQPPGSAGVDKLIIDGRGTTKQLSTPTGSQPSSPNTSTKPPIPPRRRRLWEMASAFGERATNWGKDNGESVQEKEKLPKKVLPVPPPSHPSAPHAHANIAAPQPQAAPPLPKRNEMRGASPRGGASDSGGEIAPSGTEATEGAATIDNVADDSGKWSRHPSPESFITPTDEISLPLDSSSSATKAKDDVAAGVPREQVSTPPQMERAPSPHTPPRPQTLQSPPARPRSCVKSPIPQPPPSPMSLSPSHTGSPAPCRTVPLPPSRTGSPAPPVPRRAPARRAAPVPPSTSGAAAVPQRSAILGNADPAAMKADDESVLAKDFQGTKRDMVAAVRSPVSECAVPNGAFGDGEGPATASTLDTPPQVNDQVSAGGSGMDAAVQGPAKDSLEQPAAPFDKSHAESSELSKTTSEPKSVCTDDSPADSRPATPALSGKDSRRSSTENENSIGSGTKPPSTDGGIFASDATWEGRTWKEVARLREEMFWARVGCVREA